MSIYLVERETSQGNSTIQYTELRDVIAFSTYDKARNHVINQLYDYYLSSNIYLNRRIILYKNKKDVFIIFHYQNINDEYKNELDKYNKGFNNIKIPIDLFHIDMCKPNKSFKLCNDNNNNTFNYLLIGNYDRILSIIDTIEQNTILSLNDFLCFKKTKSIFLSFYN